MGGKADREKANGDDRIRRFRGDIGGHGDVPVIEVLVAVGDTVKKGQGLVTLESDKATMEVPAAADGVVTALKVKLGDKVSEGAVIAVIAASDSGTAVQSAATAASLLPSGEGARRRGMPVMSSSAQYRTLTRCCRRPPGGEVKAGRKQRTSGRKADLECAMVVIGAGPGGYTAAFRAADLGRIRCWSSATPASAASASTSAAFRRRPCCMPPT